MVPFCQFFTFVERAIEIINSMQLVDRRVRASGVHEGRPFRVRGMVRLFGDGRGGLSPGDEELP